MISVENVRLVKKSLYPDWSWTYYSLTGWAEGYKISIFRFKKYPPRLFVTNPKGYQIYGHMIEYAKTDTELVARGLKVIDEDIQKIKRLRELLA